MDKEGKVSVEFLIGMIILVISFVVILYFIFLVDFGSGIDREVCHQSVVYRSTAKAGFIQASGIIPLKCQTEKICLTMSGEDCIELSSTKDNKVNKIRLSSDPKKAREKIIEVFAESMVSCHSMLGEGKLNFMPQKNWKTNYGLICNRIAFDQQVKNEIEDISYGEFYGYLERQTIDQKSYLEFLYPGWKNSGSSIKLFQAFKEEDSRLKNVNPIDWKIDLNQKSGYAIIAQIAPLGDIESWAKGVGTSVGVGAVLTTGVVLVASGVGAPVGAALLVGAGTIATVSVVSGGAVLWYSYKDEFDYAPPAIYPFNIENLRNAGIYSFEIAP